MDSISTDSYVVARLSSTKAFHILIAIASIFQFSNCKIRNIRFTLGLHQRLLVDYCEKERNQNLPFLDVNPFRSICKTFCSPLRGEKIQPFCIFFLNCFLRNWKAEVVRNHKLLDIINLFILSWNYGSH